jgi:hypothetical protein
MLNLYPRPWFVRTPVWPNGGKIFMPWHSTNRATGPIYVLCGRVRFADPGTETGLEEKR